MAEEGAALAGGNPRKCFLQRPGELGFLGGAGAGVSLTEVRDRGAYFRH